MAERKPPRGFARTFTTRLEEAGDGFMKAWRTQAKRPDRIGEVSYRGLELVHGGVEITIRSLGRLEHATQVPHRTVRPHPHPEPQPEPPAVEAARRPAHRPERHEPKPAAS